LISIRKVAEICNLFRNRINKFKYLKFEEKHPFTCPLRFISGSILKFG